MDLKFDLEYVRSKIIEVRDRCKYYGRRGGVW